MLKRIPRLRPSHSLVSSRKISDSSYRYPFSDKLRAFPFTISPEDAMLCIAPYASLLCKDKIISSAIGRSFPSLKLDIIRPTRITPVYFPAWIIDAELRAGVKFQSTEKTGIAQFSDTYLPGSDFKVLSAISFWSDRFSSAEPEPFAEERRHQHGYEISCLPYTISPFSVLDVAHSLSYSDAKISDGFSFSPSTVKADFFAAYPVLIPLYLAQYEIKAGSTDSIGHVTMFMEAFTGDGIVYAENALQRIDPEYAEGLKVGMRWVGFGEPEEAIHKFSPTADFVNLQSLSFSSDAQVSQKLGSWLEQAMRAPDTAQKLAEASSKLLTGDDLRIRELKEEERSPVEEYLDLGEDLFKGKRMTEIMSSAKSGHQIKTFGLGKVQVPEEIVDGAIGQVEEIVADAERKRNKAMPKWWTEWEKTQQ